jgi:hypothetical protein
MSAHAAVRWRRAAALAEDEWSDTLNRLAHIVNLSDRANFQRIMV